MPTYIKAPYNFVPFNKEVVTPHWMDQISHDLPFADGKSGTIKLTLTAKSPVFVRDGIGQQQARKNEIGGVQQHAHTFSKYGDRFFIPGSSIKGMLRSVLEILSFGSMEEKVNDHRYAVRDLNPAANHIYLKQFQKNTIYAGWLTKKDETYYLQDCGEPGRISHEMIDAGTGSSFQSFYSSGGGFMGNSDEDKSAVRKYEEFGTGNLIRHFLYAETKNGQTLYSITKGEEEPKGTLVFTGQPGVGRKQKKLEFIFFESENQTEEIPQKVIEEFMFSYHDKDDNRSSIDWKARREELEAGKQIPVFFQRKGKQIAHFGLSYLYKLPYHHSVRSTIKQHQGTNNPDFSDAIFGHIRQGKEQLRGRVHIGHAFSDNAEELEEVQEVLSGPKASYYPNYIRQDIENEKVSRYDTFMDEGAEISGWKRYPVHQGSTPTRNPRPANSSDKILTKFKPLKAGTEFTFTIRYHNLRPMELGALLSAITFHGQEADVFHSIGMGKPLGYGKMKLEIISMPQNHDKDSLLGDFEAYMNARLPNTVSIWHESPQVKELITMSMEQTGADLSYMNMEMRGDNEFTLAKGAREALDLYSVLTGQDIQVKSFCTQEEIERMKTLYRQEKDLFSHQAHLEEVLAEEKRATRVELEEAIAVKKAELLSKLTEIKQAATLDSIEAERKKEADERHERAKKYGPDWHEIDLTVKNAFQHLQKSIEAFGRDYHRLTDKELLETYPQGSYLLEKYHEALLEKLTIIAKSTPRTKKLWLTKRSKDSEVRNMIQWMGKEKTEAFLDSLS